MNTTIISFLKKVLIQINVIQNMLNLDRTNVSEGIDVNKTSALKKLKFATIGIS